MRILYPLLLALPVVSGAPPAPGQELYPDDLQTLMALMSHQTDLANEWAPEVEEIERLSVFVLDVEEALQANTDSFEQINAAIGANDDIRAMYESPEWLHGVDLVSAGGRPELPGAEGASDKAAPTTIWAVGWSGLVLRSDDNGGSWDRQDAKTSANLMDVDFVTATFGLAVGEGGTILRTTDGGDGWQVAGTQATDLHREVDCIDITSCWVVGDYPHVYRSDDGGQSWQALGTSAGFDRLASIRMLSAEVGVAGGGDTIWRTTDGGASWQRVHVFRHFGLSPVRAVMTAIDSADGKTVWAVGRARGGLAILRSIDGGESWVSQTERIRAKDYLNLQDDEQVASHRATAVFAVSGEQAHVVATNGVILATTDQGRNWWLQMATGNPNDSLHALVMRDGGVGWAVGNFGQVVATNTGGLFWVQQRGPIRAMYDIAAEMLGLAIDEPSVLELRRLRREQRYPEALELSERMLAEDPDNRELVGEASLLRYRAASAANAEGRAAEAIDHYTRAIALRDGDYPAALNNRGLIYARQGELSNAMADIDAAAERAPDNSLYLANRCLVRRLSGDAAGALEDCEAAVALGLPSNAGNRSWVMLQRGLVRRITGDVDGAVADFVAAVSDAERQTVERIQELMRGAGLYDGAVDGEMDEALGRAIELCVRDDACFDQASGRMAEMVDFMP